MDRNISLVLLLCLVMSTAACTVKAVGDPERPITIKAHILVDIRELESTAAGIEDTIAEEAVAKEMAAKAPTKMSLLSLARKWLGPGIAYAEGGYDIKEMTPEIRAAFDRRTARYKELVMLKSLGKVGEDNEGHVKDLSGNAEVARLVDAENKDREVIYKAIVKQNGLPANAIYTVRSVFADVQRSKMKPGEKIQLPDGRWATKS